MAEMTMSGMIRKILTPNFDLAADEVVRRVIAKGLSTSPKSILANVYNMKSVMKKERAGAPRVVPAAARETSAPKVTSVISTSSSQPTSETSVLTGVLANIALVNNLVGLCGGVENVRRAVESVQACGGIDAFVQHLELVASIRGVESAK